MKPFISLPLLLALKLSYDFRCWICNVKIKTKTCQMSSLNDAKGRVKELFFLQKIQPAFQRLAKNSHYKFMSLNLFKLKRIIITTPNMSCVNFHNGSTMRIRLQSNPLLRFLILSLNNNNNNNKKDKKGCKSILL